MLQRGPCRVPVTALAFHGQYLLVGEGTRLKVYVHRTHHLVNETWIFDAQSIHGIETVTIRDGEIIAIVWGGSHIAAVVISNTNSGYAELNVRNVLPNLTCPDWILHACSRPPANNDPRSSTIEVALVTAHNALILLTFDIESVQKPQLKDLTAQSKCILYSAHARWTASHTITVAAGTVFGDIIVWTCDISNDASRATLLRVLTGHEGSVFGLQLAPHRENADGEGTVDLLASCSDDRTIRIWDLSQGTDLSLDPQSAADTSSNRETGFGVKLDHTNSPLNGALTHAWGHQSRLWAVAFMSSVANNKPTNLITFGEDATCHFWRLSSIGKAQTTDRVKLDLIGIISLHSGKNIWSSALLNSNDDQISVATGAADGGISLQIKDLPFLDERAYVQAHSTTDEVNISIQNDKFRSYAFLTPDYLVVVTNSGTVFLLSCSYHDIVDKAYYQSWQMVSREDELKGYSVAASINSWSIVLLSGQDGSIFQYQTDHGLRRLVNGQSKTSALLTTTIPATEANPERAFCLATTVEQRTARLLEIQHCSDPKSVEALSTASIETMLLLPHKFVVTSFAMINRHGSFTVFLGSRNGDIVVYNMPCSPLDSVLESQYILEGAHGHDAVTDLVCVDGQASSSSHSLLFSVGRDGTFTVHEILYVENYVKMQLVHKTKVPNVTTVEKIILNEKRNRLHVCAFRSKHFILYDMLGEQDLLSIDCGGLNRTWDFQAARTGEGGTLAWTKASQLCTQASKGSSVQRIHSGGHGREIKAVAVAPTNDSGGRLIATGAEDTDIKLSAQEVDGYGQPYFRCLRTLEKHVTGIQHLEWSADGRFLFSSGGFEELYAWRIRPLPILGIGVVCDSICPPETAAPDLRVTNFSVKKLSGRSSDIDSNDYMISAVRSDSTLRVYRFEASPVTDSTWTCIVAGDYLTSSLTQALHVSTSTQDLVLATSTDGHVALYPLPRSWRERFEGSEPREITWRRRHKLHQSTVHCAEQRRLDQHNHVLFTGGDDNALSISRLSKLKEGMQVVTVTIPRAHSAAVTGIGVIDLPGRPNTFWVVTSSIDQRIKLWEVQVDLAEPGIDGIGVRRLQNVYTPVADVSSLAVFKDNEGTAVIVCGVGMDIWRVQLPGI